MQPSSAAVVQAVGPGDFGGAIVGPIGFADGGDDFHSLARALVPLAVDVLLDGRNLLQKRRPSRPSLTRAPDRHDRRGVGSTAELLMLGSRPYSCSHSNRTPVISCLPSVWVNEVVSSLSGPYFQIILRSHAFRFVMSAMIMLSAQSPD